MSQAGFAIVRASLLAVTFVTAATLLRADDQKTAESTRIVPVQVGGHTLPVQVYDSNPFKKVNTQASSGPYDPRFINFSAESSMANKKFDAPSEANAQKNSNHQKESFVTKAYHDDSGAPTVADLNTKASFPNANEQSKSTSDFKKSFFTASASENHAADLGKGASEDQNRSATLGGPEKQEGLTANEMSNKQYLGPGAQRVPEGIDVKENIVLSRVQDIPNRALTIDEVKKLINHETKPNTEEKADDTSKPLNDPKYKPEPLREDPQPASTSSGRRPADDDKEDSVPGPGMMAQPHPENSESLPQR